MILGKVLFLAGFVGCATTQKPLVVSAPVTQISCSLEEVKELSLVRTNPASKAEETLTLTEEKVMVTRSGLSFEPKFLPLEKERFQIIVKQMLPIHFPVVSPSDELIQEIVVTKTNGESQKIGLEQVMSSEVQPIYQALMMLRQNVLNEGKPLE